jgi:hypothetical protein
VVPFADKVTEPTRGSRQPKDADTDELARLRAEKKKLKAANQKLAGELGWTKSALEWEPPAVIEPATYRLQGRTTTPIAVRPPR